MEAHGRKPPQRTTVDMFLRVQPDIKAKARTLARRAGMEVSPFVSALIAVADADTVQARPAANATGTALISNRIATRLAELRAQESSEPSVSIAIAELDALRLEVVEALQMLVPAYEAAVNRSRVLDDWPAF